MGRYLSIVLLGVAAALSASLLPQVLSVVRALAGDALPWLQNTRGQLSLVMLLVLCWSLRAPLSEALTWALVGGLALDLLSVLPLGATSAAAAGGRLRHQTRQPAVDARAGAAAAGGYGARQHRSACL